MKKVLPYILALLLFISAVAHIINPDFYAPLMPEFIPVQLGNIFATITEFVIGVMLILPQYKKLGGLAFMILMIIFLPLHIWELFKENPLVGPWPAPLIRLVLQFVLIYAGWWIYRSKKTQV